MCQILYLPKDHDLPPEDDVINSVLNNPHGWGSVIHDRNRLEIRRRPGTNTKPETVLKWLEKNKEADRYIHLRWRTEGEINKENCHPFDILTTNQRRITMMHNGTFQAPFKPHHTDKINSDTKLFADEFMKPLFDRYIIDGEKGVVDDLLIDLIDQRITGMNKVLLIRSDGEPLFFGGFTHTKDKDNKILFSFANTYSHRPNYRTPHQKKTLVDNTSTNNVVPWKPPKDQKDKTTSSPETNLTQQKNGTTTGAGTDKTLSIPGDPQANFTQRPASVYSDEMLARVATKEMKWTLSQYGVDHLDDAAMLLRHEWLAIQRDDPMKLISIIEEMAYNLHLVITAEG